MQIFNAQCKTLCGNNNAQAMPPKCDQTMQKEISLPFNFFRLPLAVERSVFILLMTSLLLSILSCCALITVNWLWKEKHGSEAEIWRLWLHNFKLQNKLLCKLSDVNKPGRLFSTLYFPSQFHQIALPSSGRVTLCSCFSRWLESPHSSGQHFEISWAWLHPPVCCWPLWPCPCPAWGRRSLTPGT